MNALRALMAQHDRVEGLLVDLGLANDQGDEARRRALREFATDLRRHLEIEETLFYPAIAPRLILVEADPFLDEHQLLKDALARVESLGDLGGPEYQRAYDKLRDVLVRHVGDEEIELFPEVKRRFQLDDLDAMGEQIERAGAVEEMAPPPQPAPVREAMVDAEPDAEHEGEQAEQLGPDDHVEEPAHHHSEP